MRLRNIALFIALTGIGILNCMYTSKKAGGETTLFGSTDTRYEDLGTEGSEIGKKPKFTEKRTKV